MNYAKYSQTAGLTAGPLLGNTGTSSNASVLAQSGARPSSNSRGYQMPTNGPMTSAIPAGRQEQSVERLKSCIADLKKLATNKVKRGSSHAHGASRRDRDCDDPTYPAGYPKAPSYAPREMPSSQPTDLGRKSSTVAAHTYNNSQTSGNLTSSKMQSKTSLLNQPGYSTSAVGRESQPERKQHSTKIANALKKYINEIEATTAQIQNGVVPRSSSYL